MRSVSHFDVTVDVANPTDFCSDKKRNALRAVREIYEGRCFMGKFIVRVLDVVAMSACRLGNVGNLGAGTVDVRFRALWARRGKGALLPMVRVANIGEIVIGRHETAALDDGADGAADGAPDSVADGASLMAGEMSLAGDEPMSVSFLNPSELFAVGQLVPARVHDVQYTPMGRPTATATLLTCRDEAPVWRVAGRGEVPESLAVKLEAALALYHGAAQRAAQADNGQVLQNFFTSLLSPYRGGEAPLPAGLEPVGVDAARAVRELRAAMAPGTLWTRPLEKPFGWVGACRVADGSDAAAGAQAAPAAAVLAHVVTELVGELEVLAALSTQFKTIEDINAQRGLWALMQAAQRA